MSTDTASDALPAGLSGHAFSSLFQAVTGLRNRPAIIAMLGCIFVGIIVAGLLLAMSARSASSPACSPSSSGSSPSAPASTPPACFRWIMRAASRRAALADALVYGLMCIPKLIVLGLAFFAVEIAVFIVLALLILICKIPFLGPLLFVVVFPLSVVAAGVTIAGLFLCLVLSLPAIWQGASITRALGADLRDRQEPPRRGGAAARLPRLSLLRGRRHHLRRAGFGLLPTFGMSASIVGFGGFGMDVDDGDVAGRQAAATPSPARSAAPCSGRSRPRWSARSTCSASRWSTCASPKAST